MASSINGDINASIDPASELLKKIDGMTEKIAEMESTLSNTQIDPNMMYQAVRQGASDSTLSVTLNHRELSRQVNRMGGSK